MPDTPDWQLPVAVQPHGEDFAFDIEQALAAVVGLSARIPDDAFTASILGTERAGHGVVISKDGLVLHHRLPDHRSGRPSGSPSPTAAACRDMSSATTRRPVSASSRRWRISTSSALRLGDLGGAASRSAIGVVVAALGRPRPRRARRAHCRQAGIRRLPGNTSSTKAIFTAPAHPFWGGAAGDWSGRRPHRHRLAPARAGRRW